jgi:hypothetical protein
MGLFSQHRVRWALAVVALIEVALFAWHLQGQWRLLTRVGTPQTLAGDGLVVLGDGLGYYAWLRSLLIDGDWSFENEFDEHNTLGSAVPTPVNRTAPGRRANHWSVGPACVWALAVVPGHLAVLALQGYGLPWPADGYSVPYQLLVGGTTLLVSLVGLVLVYGICRHYARPVRAAAAATLLTLGTTIVFYSTVEVSMAHGIGTAVLAALVWYWLRSFGSARAGRWLLVGALLGAAALMRWQLATFAILPTGEALLACWQLRRARPLFHLGLAGLAAVFAFVPQMIAWRCVYGEWLLTPLPLGRNWSHPALWLVLWSQDRSLFYWTPICLLACVGYLGLLRPGLRPWEHTLSRGGPAARAPLALLAAAFVLQVYLLASIRGFAIHLGAAYGHRLLTEALVALAPGLALLLEAAGPRTYRWLCGLGCALVLWNLLLITQYRYFLINHAGATTPALALDNLRWLAHYKLHTVAWQMAGVLALGMLLGHPGAGPARFHLRSRIED